MTTYWYASVNKPEALGALSPGVLSRLRTTAKVGLGGTGVEVTICLLPARSIPTIAFDTGTRARRRSSRALRLRSPRDTPLPLLSERPPAAWDTKPEAHQGGVPTSRTDTQNVFLCRAAGDYSVPLCRARPRAGG
jgi:hypothetical protein